MKPKSREQFQCAVVFTALVLVIATFLVLFLFKGGRVCSWPVYDKRGNYSVGNPTCRDGPIWMKAEAHG